MDRSTERCERLRHAAVRRSGILAGRRRRRAATRLARVRTADAARCLAQVFVDAVDERVAAVTEQALVDLTDSTRQDARDAVCEVTIATGDRRLSDLVGRVGHLPSDPRRRALLLFLSGRHDEYAGLDFDGDLLRAAYQNADTDVRRRVAEAARAAGRTEVFRAAVTPAKRAGDLSDSEWNDTVTLLTDAARWQELWELATEAPLPWAARILRDLRDHGFTPESEGDRPGYDRLLELAGRCPSAPSTASLFGAPRVLDAKVNQLSGIAMRRDGRVLALAHGIGPPSVRLWRTDTGKPAGEYTGDGLLKNARSVAMTPDGETVAFGEFEGVAVWRPASDQAATWLPAGRMSDITALAVTPDGEVLAAANTKGRVWLWHLPSGRRLAKVVAAHDRGIPSLVVTPDSRLLVTGIRAQYSTEPGFYRSVRLWHLPSGEPAGRVKVGEGGVRSLMVTPDGRLLVTVGVDGTTGIWRLPGLTPVASMSYEAKFSDVAMSADGTLLAGKASSKVIEVRRLPSAELLTTIRIGERNHTYYASFAISPDNRLLFGSGTASGTWRLPSGDTAGKLPDVDWDYAEHLHFTADGVAVAGAGPRVMICRPDPIMSGRRPVGRITVEEAERFARRRRRKADRPLAELLLEIVRWRHRYDVAIGDAGGVPPRTHTDVEVSE